MVFEIALVALGCYLVAAGIALYKKEQIRQRIHKNAVHSGLYESVGANRPEVANSIFQRISKMFFPGVKVTESVSKTSGQDNTGVDPLENPVGRGKKKDYSRNVST